MNFLLRHLLFFIWNGFSDGTNAYKISDDSVPTVIPAVQSTKPCRTAKVKGSETEPCINMYHQHS